MINRGKEEKTKKFIYALPQMAAIEFIGLCNLFRVRILEDDTAEPRDFGDMLEDCIDKFETLNARQQKEVLKMLKQLEKTNKKEMKQNGTGTEHS